MRADRYFDELLANPDLVDLILARLDVFPLADQERVDINTDAVSVDAALARALALAVGGVVVTLTLEAER
jgi:hypothetical protein